MSKYDTKRNPEKKKCFLHEIQIQKHGASANRSPIHESVTFKSPYAGRQLLSSRSLGFEWMVISPGMSNLEIVICPGTFQNRKIP